MVDEDAYILFLRKNAIQVLIPKYGLEGTIFMKPKDKGRDIPLLFDEEVS